jgi:two-component system nitrate/nitrite response regulator NarL
VAELGDGREALTAIKEQAPDVALLDYKLPGLDGWRSRTQSTARGPRRRCSCSRPLPTAVSSTRSCRRARQATCRRRRGASRSSTRCSAAPAARRFEIAKELFLGVTTVKTHVQQLYEKLDVSDRAAAVAEAMRKRLIE